jgi:hypothetical protein
VSREQGAPLGSVSDKYKLVVLEHTPDERREREPVVFACRKPSLFDSPAYFGEGHTCNLARVRSMSDFLRVNDIHLSTALKIGGIVMKNTKILLRREVLKQMCDENRVELQRADRIAI